MTAKRNKVTTTQLAARISRETDVEERVVREVLDTLGLAVGEYLRRDYAVRVDSFGEFNSYQRATKPQQVKALQGIADGVAPRPTNVVVFRQSKGLKEILRCRTKRTPKKA